MRISRELQRVFRLRREEALKIKSDSFDMRVNCIYRTNKNRRVIASPRASFHWYVDGVTEKTLEKNWEKLDCSESIRTCRANGQILHAE